MTREKDNLQERSVPQNEASTFELLVSMADTTWRMFTPPAIFVAGGIWADLKFGTKPWLTALATVIGLAFSVLLVRQQLRKVQ